MPTMVTNNRSLELLIKELKTVMKEIEDNPSTSSWTIRMALKAIVEKAERKMEETV